MNIAIVREGAIVEIRSGVPDDAILAPDTMPVVSNKPAVNEATHKAVAGTPFVDGPVVTIPWSVVALNAEELTVVADKATETQFRQSINTAIQKCGDGSATNAELKTYLYHVLRWIRKQEGLS